MQDPPYLGDDLYSDDPVAYLSMLLMDPYWHWLCDSHAAAHLLDIEPKNVSPAMVEQLKSDDRAQKFHLMRDRVEKEAFLEYQAS